MRACEAASERDATRDRDIIRAADRMKSSRKDRREVTDVSTMFIVERKRGTLLHRARANLSHPTGRTRHGLTHPRRPQDRSHPAAGRLHLSRSRASLALLPSRRRWTGISVLSRVPAEWTPPSFNRHCLTSSRRCIDEIATEGKKEGGQRRRERGRGRINAGGRRSLNEQHSWTTPIFISS